MVITTKMIGPSLGVAAVLVSVVLWLASVHHTANEAHDGLHKLQGWKDGAETRLVQQDRDLLHLLDLLARVERKLDKRERKR
jgi:hypothetical protein